MFWKFSSNLYNFVETLLKFAKVKPAQTSIKFLQKFHKRFASVSGIIVTNYFHGFNKLFSPTFTITLIRPIIFLKFCAKILYCFDTVPQLLLFKLTKITRHYFYKTYTIFEKFERVSRTFSISSSKFLLKLSSHFKKLLNMSQVFHLRWETIGLQFWSMGSCRTNDLFPTCLWTIAELCQ